MKKLLLPLFLSPLLLMAEVIETDLLIVGGDESGCAAAVQAARLGVKRIVLVNDIDWLGGQFCTQGIGPMDEWTLVNGKRTEFPATGAFAEILERIHQHNRRVYGIARPGNSWCGSNTIEPKAAAQIFEDWLAPYKAQITILKGWEPSKVLVEDGRVVGCEFRQAERSDLTIKAKLTADSTDWGDIIRLSGASYMAGPDLKSRFGEPSAPETLDEGGHQEMNPITWCPLLRETGGKDSTITKPARYDAHSFANWQKAPPWVDWDGSGGIYHPAGWCIYTHRRIVDRYHHGLAAGTEAVILNWPAHDYPLSTLPQYVVQALEANEAGASKKNIVAMSPTQRRIVFADAKQRALEFVYWLQTAAHDRVGDFPQSFRYMKLADDYGTADHLPPKPYIREGLRLNALYVLREQDVRTELEKPLWAKVMPFDGVFGYQFNMDFHPTRRKFRDDDATQPWQPKFFGTRNWNAHSDRTMFPLRGLVPVKIDGLLGCSKNIGVTSMVQSSLRLHGQMMQVGTAVGTVAAHALKDGIQPRDIATSPKRIRAVQTTLLRHATLLWPWQDVKPDEPHFEAANLLTIAGIWRADQDNVFFKPDQTVTRRELASTLARLMRSLPEAKAWPEYPATPRFSDVAAEDRALIEAMITWGSFGTQPAIFKPNETVTWDTLNRWLAALKLPTFATLSHAKTKAQALSRSECVDYLYRALQQRGETLPPDKVWLQSGGDDDGDGRKDYDDALPFDRDNNNISDKLQAPNLAQTSKPFGRRVLVSDYGGNKVAIIAADGRVEWEFPAEKPQDVWMLSTGNVLFSHVRGAREVTMAKKIVWEYTSPEGTEVHGCQPLPDGRIMVVECGTKRLVEVSRDGKITREIAVPVKTKNTHDQMRGCRRTLDGRYFISAKGDRAILELSAEGKLLRSFKMPGDPHEVRELPNGHLLIACGEGEALLELDREGKAVWKLGTQEVPNNPLRLISGFQRLPDGHTLVINWLGHGYLASTAQFFELDEQKQIVHQFTDHSRFVSINKVQVLDLPGDPAKDEVWR
jgi:FAD dependent oxidoreductase